LSVLPDKPGVDDRAFVPTDKFRNLEHPQGPERRPLAIVPGVDNQPFVSPDKFRNLDHVPTSTRPIEEVPEQQRPPRVIQPLSNSDLEELMPVLLTTTIDAGVPMASVRIHLIILSKNEILIPINCFENKTLYELDMS